MGDIDQVAAALEGVGLGELDAADFARFETHHQRVLAIGQRGVARDQGHGRLVGGKTAADQAGLGQVDAVAFLLQQGEGLHRLVFARAGGLGVLEQLGADQRTALAVEGQAHHVGGHGVAHLGCGGGAIRRIARRDRAGGTRQSRGQAATGRRSRSGGARGRGSRHRCRREKGRRIAVVDLPFVPDQHHGETKNHPQDGPTDVIHDGCFFSEEGEIRRENKAGGWTGTGS